MCDLTSAAPVIRRLRECFGIALELVEVAPHLPRRAGQLKIILIELGDALQPLDVAQRKLPLLERDERVGAELLQDAVDVDGGQASVSASSTWVSGKRMAWSSLTPMVM